MCTPEAAVIGTIVGTGAQIKAAKDQGKAAQQAAQMNAKQAIIENENNKLQARQFVNARLEQLDKAMEVNNAMFAYANRADQSIDAFRKAEADIAYRDIDRGITQAMLTGAQSLMRGQQEIQRGRIAQQTARIQTASMLGSGIYQLSQIKYTTPTVSGK
jgi:hypothetical protein